MLQFVYLKNISNSDQKRMSVYKVNWYDLNVSFVNTFETLRWKKCTKHRSHNSYEEGRGLVRSSQTTTCWMTTADKQRLSAQIKWRWWWWLGWGGEKKRKTDGQHNDNSWPRFGDHCHCCRIKMWYPFNNDKRHVNLVIIIPPSTRCVCTLSSFVELQVNAVCYYRRGNVYYFIDRWVTDSPLFDGNEKLKRKYTTCSGRWAFECGSVFHTRNWPKKKHLIKFVS